jgi:hypothetical protein
MASWSSRLDTGTAFPDLAVATRPAQLHGPLRLLICVVVYENPAVQDAPRGGENIISLKQGSIMDSPK